MGLVVKVMFGLFKLLNLIVIKAQQVSNLISLYIFLCTKFERKTKTFEWHKRKKKTVCKI